MRKLMPLLILLAGCGKESSMPQAPYEEQLDSGPYAAIAIPTELGPSLPNVLLIGDSVSYDYTVLVKEALKGYANVYRAPENCKYTGYALTHVDAWLGTTKWDVIHFNFGLHDLAWRDWNDPNHPMDLINGTLTTSLVKYESNLQTLVVKMQDTGAKLIWASTTPVPATGAPGRKANSELQYNLVAKSVMDSRSVTIDDLHEAVIGNLEQLQKPGDIHFFEEGSVILANQVVQSIKGRL